MSSANFVIYPNEVTVNNISNIKEFSEHRFLLEISNEVYELNGIDLALKEVSSDNHTIKISGTVESIEKKNKKGPIEKKGFFKRLFQ